MSSKRYTSEFRAEAIRQVTERGYPVSEVSRRLGVSSYSLYKWLKGVNRTPRLVAQEDLRAENARLKSELKRVEKERDIQPAMVSTGALGFIGISGKTESAVANIAWPVSCGSTASGRFVGIRSLATRLASLRWSLRTDSNRIFPWTLRIGSGLRISPISGPSRSGSIWRSSWICIPGSSSVGR